MKIIIDPGHGGKESGAVAYGMMEKDLNLTIARILADRLEQSGISVDRSIIADVYHDSTTLSNLIVNSGATLCISCHNNSYNGSARGMEVIHSIHSNGALAKNIIAEVAKTGFPVRRAYSKKNDATGNDYYFVIRLTYPKVETIIVEFGFMDNLEDFKLLTNSEWQNKLTAAVAQAVKSYIPAETPSRTQILGNSILTSQQLKKALKDINPLAQESIADIYYALAPIYGVKSDLAFLQSMNETNWLKFTGVVKASQNNFAGLGATSSSNPGLSFPTVEAGVEAHIQHLYAYSSTSPIPAGRTLYDARFGLVTRGSAVYWEDLNGKWAVPGFGYGESILALQKMVYEKYPSGSSEEPQDPDPPVETPVHWAKECNDELMAAGLLYDDHTKTLDSYATEGMLICLVNRLRKEFLKNG